MRKTLNLKTESLAIAGSTTPPPQDKYTTDHGRTSKMPPMAATPRDSDAMATGVTGGNHQQVKIPNLQVQGDE
jgi:hypothetical protein